MDDDPKKLSDEQLNAEAQFYQGVVDCCKTASPTSNFKSQWKSLTDTFCRFSNELQTEIKSRQKKVDRSTQTK